MSKPKKKPRTKKPEIKTEGQRLLLEVDGSESELAKQLGCGAAIIGHWKRGRRVPGGPARHKMSLLFSIPQRAWDVAPGKVAAPSKPAATEKGRDDDILDITKTQIFEILESLDDDTLTKEVRARTRTDLTKLLALRARIEKDRELGEDRMVREHPEWARVKAAILKALKPFPEAAAAVAKVLA
jgi:hypothetical protein